MKLIRNSDLPLRSQAERATIACLCILLLPGIHSLAILPQSLPFSSVPQASFVRSCIQSERKWMGDLKRHDLCMSEGISARTVKTMRLGGYISSSSRSARIFRVQEVRFTLRGLQGLHLVVAAVGRELVETIRHNIFNSIQSVTYPATN